MNLATIEIAINQAKSTIENNRKSYEREQSKLKEEVSALVRDRALLLNNYDLGKVKLAENVLRFSDGLERLDKSVVTDAVKELSIGGGYLKNGYMGIKDYAHWRGQRCDCSYHMGPSHGTIVFNIGLKVRDRDLTEQEVDACLYYLHHLNSGKLKDYLVKN